MDPNLPVCHSTSGQPPAPKQALRHFGPSGMAESLDDSVQFIEQDGIV